MQNILSNKDTQLRLEWTEQELTRNRDEWNSEKDSLNRSLM